MKILRQADEPATAKRSVAPPSCPRGRHRMQRVWPRLAVVGFLPLTCLGLAAAVLPSAAAQTREEKPAAIVGGETFYEKDFLPQIQGQVYKIRRQEYELKRKALEDALNKKLMRAEAQKRGISEEEWLRQEVDSKVAEPTTDEIEQEFASRMFRGETGLSMEAIAEELKQEWVQQEREEFFRKLRERAGVKIYLLPPRVEVGYDPGRVRGNPKAKIIMVEFSDFHCPYCQQAYSTVKALLKKYDGKVMLAYRDLPLQEVSSEFADSPEAARCAGEQGKFWEYHDLLFENQDSYGEEAFKEFADALTLDRNQFRTCLESGKFKAPIQEDFQEGIRLGATGTPYFFINGVPLTGARPQADFEEIIEIELATMDPTPNP